MDISKVKVTKLKQSPKKHKPKTGASDVVLNMEVLDSITIPDISEMNTSMYNAIKNVKHYQGHGSRVYKSMRNKDGTRTWWREI